MAHQHRELACESGIGEFWSIRPEPPDQARGAKRHCFRSGSAEWVAMGKRFCLISRVANGLCGPIQPSALIKARSCNMRENSKLASRISTILARDHQRRTHFNSLVKPFWIPAANV